MTRGTTFTSTARPRAGAPASTAGSAVEEQAYADLVARVDDLLGPDADDTDRALIGRLLTSFVRRLPGALSAVEVALDAGDAETLVDAAHSLTGMASNVGARRLGDVAAAIEDAARSGTVPARAVAGADLRREADLAVRLVDRLAPRLDAAPSQE